MYKVWQIADGMIIWKGNTVIGIKGMTLPEMFLDCDCVKLPRNAFDYCLATTNKYTEEQLAFINKAVSEWQDPVELVEVEEEPEGESGPVDWMIRSDAFEQEDNNSWDDDDLPF